MTANDKKLLVIAVAFLLVFGIAFLGIRPAVNGIKAAKAKNEELSAKKTEMSNEIAATPTYKATLEAAKADYAKTSERIYGDLTNDRIHDAVIDTLVVPCGLSITNFTINSVAKLGILPYTVSKTEEGATVGQGGESAENANVRLASVTVTVSGNADQITTFIDKLNADEGIYLQNASFTNSSEATSVPVSFYMVLSETFA